MKSQQFLLTALLIAVATTLNAQKPIKGTATDENYAYTTVVYKDSSATDQQVLEQMDENLGIGDVVRITVAPPKPKPAPAVQASPQASVMPAPRTIKPSPATPNSPVLLASDDKNAVMQQISRQPTTTAFAPAANTASTSPTVMNTEASAQNINTPATFGASESPASIVKTQKTVQGKKSGAAVKKSTGKSKKSYGKAPKNKKRNKQRYGCFKF